MIFKELMYETESVRDGDNKDAQFRFIQVINLDEILLCIPRIKRY